MCERLAHELHTDVASASRQLKQAVRNGLVYRLYLNGSTQAGYCEARTLRKNRVWRLTKNADVVKQVRGRRAAHTRMCCEQVERSLRELTGGSERSTRGVTITKLLRCIKDTCRIVNEDG